MHLDNHEQLYHMFVKSYIDQKRILWKTDHLK